MNSPTLICGLLALALILVLIGMRKQFENGYAKCLYRSSLFFLILYLLIQVGVYIRWEFFITENTVADTNRNFTFITGGIFSLLVSILFLIIDLIRVFLKIKKSK